MESCKRCYRCLFVAFAIFEIVGIIIRCYAEELEFKLVGWMFSFTGVIIAVISLVLLAIVIDNEVEK